MRNLKERSQIVGNSLFSVLLSITIPTVRLISPVQPKLLSPSTSSLSSASLISLSSAGPSIDQYNRLKTPPLKRQSEKHGFNPTVQNPEEQGRTMASNIDETPIPLMVEEEYNRALRTKSFVDIWRRAHHQLKKTTTTTTSEEEEGNTQTSPLSLRYYTHLPESLLEPSQETLLAATWDDSNCTGHGGGRRLHILILDYFDTTLEACNACTSLLACIDRARAHRRSLHHLLCSNLPELSSYVLLDNPLSSTNLSQFHRARALYSPLTHRLATARQRIARHAKILQLMRKASSCVIAATCGVLAFALAVAPEAAEVGPRVVDAAAKGAYIVERDLDTVSRMVRRLQDEVEHGREVARMVLRDGEPELAKEVVREVESEEAGFREQLEELEEHVYLCMLTINRSRRLVAQEMGGAL